MYELVIIGAGPAGLTAALYAGRFRINAIVLEKLSVGGQILLSSVIENYPGFPGGISTEELIDKFKAQVDEVGIKIKTEEVLEVLPSFKLEAPLYNIRTDNNSYEAKSLIIAAGANPKKLGIEGEDRFIGRGVSYCGTCDGPLFKDKDIIVVGGGDRAIEEAIFLAGYAKKVNLIHRRQAFRASKILEEKAKQNPRINFVLDTVLEKICGKDKVEEVIVKNVKTGSETVIHCQGVFIFVGIIPETAFLKNLIKLDEAGFIITDQNLKTSCEGVFACGDCRRKDLYQVVTACGEGAVAADSAYKYLMK
jgi:thioredoxin reductase (NADPH)